MGMQDRDWYREHHAKQNASNANSLASIVNRAEKRRRTSKLAMALVWLAVIAALYYAFTLAGRFAH